MIGPFGTIENPVLIPSVTTERVVGCTGGTGDDEHMILFFRCQEGFLYRCGECDQVFMHVRVVYEHEKLWAARDPEVSDVRTLRCQLNGQITLVGSLIMRH